MTRAHAQAAARLEAALGRRRAYGAACSVLGAAALALAAAAAAAAVFLPECRDRAVAHADRVWKVPQRAPCAACGAESLRVRGSRAARRGGEVDGPGPRLARWGVGYSRAGAG